MLLAKLINKTFDFATHKHIYIFFFQIINEIHYILLIFSVSTFFSF